MIALETMTFKLKLKSRPNLHSKNPFQSSKIKIGSKLANIDFLSNANTYEKALNTENAADVTAGSARNLEDAFDQSDQGRISGQITVSEF